MFRAMRNMMMSISLLALAVGCEHKKTTDKTTGGGGNPEPVLSNPAETVRAPVAADLDAAIKDVPGTGAKLFAKIETPLGTINCELFADRAPMTVANFVGLATGKKAWMNPSGNVEKTKPYFDGLLFHRVIPSFMIQGGDPMGQGVGGPGYKFADELSPDMDMGPGTLAMANAGPVTNGSQFFIMDNASRPDLAKKHTIFGKCNELEVIAKITATPTGARDLPQTPVTMKVTISKGG